MNKMISTVSSNNFPSTIKPQPFCKLPYTGSVPSLLSKSSFSTPTIHIKPCFLDAALKWFNFGLKVIPILPGTKRPAVKHEPWLTEQSPQTIRDYWSKHPDHELGFITGDNIVVFDADTPESIKVLKIIEESHNVKPNMVSKTQKGEHHFFRITQDIYVKSDSHDSKKYPKRIDIKTGSGMIVLPPSTGKTVLVKEATSVNDIVTVDQTFIDSVFLMNDKEVPRPPEPIISPREVSADHKTIVKLLNYIDPDSGYEDWLHCLMAVNHETGGSEEGLELADAWSKKGQKYKGRKEIEAKWRSFKHDVAAPYTVGTLIKMAKDAGADVSAIVGNDSFELCEYEVVTTVSETPEIIKESEPLAAMQQQYGLINMDGKICVYDRSVLGSLTDQGLAKKLTLSNRSDGGLQIMRGLKALYPQSDAAKIVKEFWHDPKTICYDGVEFNPKGTSGNYLNLWVGPTTVPMLGRWALIKSFLLDIVCDGDQEAYSYLVGYIAHALQRPSEKPGVMIILLGGQGIGKGTLGRIFQKIWSATYIQVNDISSVTGSFNAALERSFIVFMDEALFSGNRRGSDALKSLVTEHYIQINEKYQPSRQMRSYHRFIAATNAEHFKNTERDDRRDFTLRVSESRKGDHAYWDDLNNEIINGGTEAMAYDLLAMDLSSFNVRDKPSTKEFLSQKLLSLDPIHRWWHECLDRGDISDDGKWPDFVGTNDAIEGIIAVSGGKIYRKPSAITTVPVLLKLCPSAKAHQKQTQHNRQRGLSLPSLQQARAEFEQYIGGVMQWPETDL